VILRAAMLLTLSPVIEPVTSSHKKTPMKEDKAGGDPRTSVKGHIFPYKPLNLDDLSMRE
jgi:hypothetical protein